MKISYLLAFALAAGSITWVASGQFSGDSEAGTSAQPEIKKPPVDLNQEQRIPSVRVLQQSAEDFTRHLTIRGRTEALRYVDVKSETSGRIVELPYEKGQRVESGKIIARLDVNERSAKVAEYEALKEQRAIEYAAAKRLSQKGFKAETQLAASKAALESAEAELSRVKVALSNTRIPVPFNGVLNERSVEIGEFVDVGDKIGTVVDLSTILVASDVSERLVPFISVGDPASVKLVTGERIKGSVRFIASMADPATRTFRIEIAVPNEKQLITDGMTAETTIDLNTTRAHKVSPGILTISDSGAVGVKTLNDKNQVVFREASVLENASDGLWLGGLPETLTFIVIGQELVTDGQTVTPVDARTLQVFNASGDHS
ncbi:efflux RND transporter periplasmic adaptor subunit [Kiloniella laminariae]|uniref:efflux RND transporter periplasmic adaptor subunit n=1 Tax=Kiloniella laminariae TaxID=454162 RepID=UPI00035EAC6A|nr:efflux RND transporter periplasmic adaptor subunit [Kiloniella laminariae]